MAHKKYNLLIFVQTKIKNVFIIMLKVSKTKKNYFIKLYILNT